MTPHLLAFVLAASAPIYYPPPSDGTWILEAEGEPRRVIVAEPPAPVEPPPLPVPPQDARPGQ